MHMRDQRKYACVLRCGHSIDPYFHLRHLNCLGRLLCYFSEGSFLSKVGGGVGGHFQKGFQLEHHRFAIRAENSHTELMMSTSAWCASLICTNRCSVHTETLNDVQTEVHWAGWPPREHNWLSMCEKMIFLRLHHTITGSGDDARPVRINIMRSFGVNRVTTRWDSPLLVTGFFLVHSIEFDGTLGTHSPTSVWIESSHYFSTPYAVVTAVFRNNIWPIYHRLLSFFVQLQILSLVTTI